MIEFNALLKDEDVKPKDVKLVRHQDTRRTLQPYQVWLANDGRFDLFQNIQRRPVFKGARTVASFVVTPLNETLFIGLYNIDGVGIAPSGLIDPSSGKNVGGFNLYDMTLSSKLADYRGRLTINWGLGFRSWVQLANKNQKPIIEIHRTAGEPPFPGFLDFRVRLSELTRVPSAWRIALSAVTGIYVFVNPSTGKQYVGSAQGLGGFWARWEEYVSSGHGGNRRMKDIPKSDYQISILEVASSSADPEVLFKLESRWKEKLLSRKFGLNAN